MSETETRISVADFATLHGVTMTSKPTDRNSAMGDNMDHWRCTLRCSGNRMQITFPKGVGLHGEAPSVQEVLSCCAADAGLCAQSFDDFCADAGYSNDSIEARNSFNQCVRQTTSLKRLLGSAAAYEMLVYNTEPY